MNTHNVVPILPLELMMEILSWLPVKTLMQFTCVSKSWKSLIIDDPAFAKLHLKRSPKNTDILLTLEDNGLEDSCFVSLSVRSLLEEQSSMIEEEKCCRLKGDCSVFGSCNGLICLGNFYDAGLIDELWVRLWNPATRLISEKSPTLQMNLETHEEYTPEVIVNWGFGYDDSRDNYKVVVVFWDCIKQKMETRVHRMGDSYWRMILSDPCLPILLKQFGGQFVGGCVNWLALRNLNCHDYKWENVTLQQLVIISFDMRDEVYTYMSLPEGVTEVPLIEPNLGVLGNHMCFSHDHERTHFVVWKMREYRIRESWTRLVSISYERLQYSGFPFYPLPMYLSEDGDFLFLTYTDGFMVIMYNLRDNTMEYIDILNNEDWFNWVNTDGYVSSLISPYRD